MILEFAIDGNDSSASLPIIPLPPCPVFGAVHIWRCPGTNWTRSRAADKERKRKHFRHKALSSSQSCLSVTFVCLGLIILLINVPVRDLRSARGAVNASVTCWGVRTWLALEKKRKWNWRECLSLFFQDAGVSSHHILLILSPRYAASWITQQAFSSPSLMRLCVPRSSSLLPLFRVSVDLIKAVTSPWNSFLSLQLVVAKSIPTEIANAIILYAVAF